MIFYDQIDEMTLINDAMDASGMAWWLFEYPSGVIFFNPNKLKMLGYDPKDRDKFVHISKFIDLMHPDDIERVTGLLYDYLDGKKDSYEAEYRMKTKNGKYKKFLDRGKIVGKKKDGEVAVAGFAIDISKTNLVPQSA